jgi:hypothetical protein
MKAFSACFINGWIRWIFNFLNKYDLNISLGKSLTDDVNLRGIKNLLV